MDGLVHSGSVTMHDLPFRLTGSQARTRAEGTLAQSISMAPTIPTSSCEDPS